MVNKKLDMRKLYFGLILLTFGTACRQGDKKPNDTMLPKHQNVDSLTQNADHQNRLSGEKTYQYLKNGDTISLVIQIDGEKVYGDLTYAWKEKDKNRGKVEGILRDSVLTADYTFSSEGQQSIRQVVFKLSAQRAVEGYGPMEEKAGKMLFVDSEKVAYDEKFALENVISSTK